ncbi:MAG: STAS domain-containing protein [Planctomycetota bacterium]
MMIASEKQGAVTVLTPAVPLTGDHPEELTAAINAQLGQGLPQLVLDLTSTPLMDSGGLEALLDARDSVRARGGVIRIAGPNPLVNDALVASGVGDHFELFGNTKAAVGSFAR